MNTAHSRPTDSSRPRRSQLYVPANNEKMVAKAATLDADSVVLDLEDSVPPDAKEQARATLRRLVAALDWGGRELCVRINPLSSLESYRDLLLVSGLDRVDAIVVPKAEVGVGQAYRATGKHLIPIIETARGLLKVGDIVAEEGVVAVTWGAGDLAYSVGGSVDAYSSNIYVRTLVVACAVSAGITAIDKVYFNVADTAGFIKDAEEAKRFGFTGKQVIHPSQIDPANKVFTPTKEEVDWANRVLAAYEDARRTGRGAVRVDDSLVDEVHVRMARSILQRLKATSDQ